MTVPSDQSGTIASLCYRVLAQDSDKVPIVNKNHISHSRETDSNRLLSTLFTKNRIRSYIRVKEGNAPPQAPCCGFPQFPREIRETRTGGDSRFPLFPRQKSRRRLPASVNSCALWNVNLRTIDKQTMRKIDRRQSSLVQSEAISVGQSLTDCDCSL